MVEEVNDLSHRLLFDLLFLIEKGQEIKMMVGLDMIFLEMGQCVALMPPLLASMIEIVDN